MSETNNKKTDHGVDVKPVVSKLLYHGWGITNKNLTLHIGNLPGRKSVCLYYEDNGTINTLAFFKNPESAQKAQELLDTFILWKP